MRFTRQGNAEKPTPVIRSIYILKAIYMGYIHYIGPK